PSAMDRQRALDTLGLRGAPDLEAVTRAWKSRRESLELRLAACRDEVERVKHRVAGETIDKAYEALRYALGDDDDPVDVDDAWLDEDEAPSPAPAAPEPEASPSLLLSLSELLSAAGEAPAPSQRPQPAASRPQAAA